MGARVDLRKPRVELVLEVQLVREAAARLEVRLGIALQALDDALGLRVGRLAEQPIHAQLSAQRGELLARSAAVAVDAGLAIPDQRLGKPAQLPQAAHDRAQQVRRPLAEHQRPGTGARVAKARDHHKGPARLAMTDRHLGPRLPDVKLADLARAIDGPLKRPRPRREQRPDLTQVVINDRLDAAHPSGSSSSRTRTPGSFGSAASSRWISCLNGSSLDPFAARRYTAAHRWRSPA